jgi:hypothetical protein
MAVFDLKDAAMYIRDGFADTGAVNNASGGYTALVLRRCLSMALSVRSTSGPGSRLLVTLLFTR